MKNTENIQKQKTFKSSQPSPKEVKHKKISFFSAILLVIGSSIGAGIFLKNGEILNNNNGSIILSLISWIISIVGVVAMGLSLAELSSASTNSNQGIIGWVKTFNSKFLYKSSKNFMAFFYLPINCFIMPYYVVMTIQDAFGWQTEWYYAALISFVIFLWFQIVSGLSSRAGNIQNWVITSVKFLPLIFAILVGFILLSLNLTGSPTGDVPTPWPTWDKDNKLLTQILPGLGMIGSIPAIVFSFDGFYTSAGMQSEMEKPEKTSIAMLIGLIIVSIIDVLISLSLLFGSSNGKINGLTWFNDNAHWVITVVEILIAFGILGIVNAFAMYNPRFYEELIHDNELPFSKKYQNKLNPHKPMVGVIYSGIIAATVFIIFTIIGSYGYLDANGYGTTEMYNIAGAQLANNGYGINNNNEINKLYSFVDLVGNWTSIITFIYIIIAMIGCIKNRKTNKIAVKKDKLFVPCAYVSIAIIGLGVLFVIISAFANIGLVANWKITENYTEDDHFKDMIGAIMTLVMLFVFVGGCTIPAYFESKQKK